MVGRGGGSIPPDLLRDRTATSRITYGMTRPVGMVRFTLNEPKIPPKTDRGPSQKDRGGLIFLGSIYFLGNFSERSIQKCSVLFRNIARRFMVERVEKSYYVL